MSRRSILTPSLLVAVWCISSVAQQSPNATRQQPAFVPAAGQEFPVTLQQNIVAGKTPVGSRIQAKLGEATLVKGNVVPRNAVMSGEVVESVAKSDAAASRLSLRLDSAQWKDGSVSIQAYLTIWYYPSILSADLQSGADQTASGNGMGQYSPSSPGYHPFPPTAESDSAGAATPPGFSMHRLKMKDVETEGNSDGGIALVSKKSNLKLDKATMYVFGGINTEPAKTK